MKAFIFSLAIALLITTAPLSAAAKNSHPEEYDPKAEKNIRNSWRVDVSGITLAWGSQKKTVTANFYVDPHHQKVYFSDTSVGIEVLDGEGRMLLSQCAKCSEPQNGVTIDHSDCFSIKKPTTILAALQVPRSVALKAKSARLIYLSWSTEHVAHTVRIFN
jgi:hypothetical protein